MLLNKCWFCHCINFLLRYLARHFRGPVASPSPIVIPYPTFQKQKEMSDNYIAISSIYRKTKVKCLGAGFFFPLLFFFPTGVAAWHCDPLTCVSDSNPPLSSSPPSPDLNSLHKKEAADSLLSARSGSYGKCRWRQEGGRGK